MKDVVFVTGNKEKAENFSKHMGTQIPCEAAELDEIQTLDAKELVAHKLQQAYSQINRPVLVEDVTFSFEAWGGKLPGPFVKFFVQENGGVDYMCRMLDGFDDRRATATCMYGYYDGEHTEFFVGNLEGTIALTPRGTNGYGFDRVFIPDGFEAKTAAELSDDEYDKYYSTIKPFDKVRKFLEQS